MVRLAGMVLAAIPLMAGYALILFDDRRQGLQDKLARTVVLYVPEEVELELEVEVGSASIDSDGARLHLPVDRAVVRDLPGRGGL